MYIAGYFNVGAHEDGVDGIDITALLPYMLLTMVSKPPRREKSVDSCS